MPAKRDMDLIRDLLAQRKPSMTPTTGLREVEEAPSGGHDGGPQPEAIAPGEHVGIVLVDDLVTAYGVSGLSILSSTFGKPAVVYPEICKASHPPSIR